MVTYQGGLGKGTGPYHYKDPGTAKTCSGTATYTIVTNATAGVTLESAAIRGVKLFT